MASAVAMNVFGTVITSSPAPMPNPSRDSHSAEVPLLTPAANSHPQYAANWVSNSATKGPPAKAVLSSTRNRADTTSSRMDAYCAFRSRSGTCVMVFLHSWQ